MPIALLRGLLETEHWWEDAALADALRDPLTQTLRRLPHDVSR